MKFLRNAAVAALFVLAAAVPVAPAAAQSSPGFKTGDIPTAQNWNSYFAAKLDFVPGMPDNAIPYYFGGGSSVGIVSGDCSSVRLVWNCRSLNGVMPGNLLPLNAGTGLSISGGFLNVTSSGFVTSFNSRVGAVSLLSSDVTGALGYTPVNGTIGTSGATIPLNNGNNTLSGIDNFTGTLQIAGTPVGTFATQSYATPPAIGGGTPNAGSFTTLSVSSTLSGTGVSTYLASPPAIGGTAPSTGKFTALTTTGNSILGGTVTASALSTVGTVAGSLCQTSAGLVLYEAGINCIATGTVSAGTAGQLAIYASSGSTLSGDANVTASGGALSVGQSGSVGGSLALFGSSSGSTTIVPVAAAGTSTITLPAATDTVALLAATQTLTNKSIAASEINSGTLAAAQMLPLATGDVYQGNGSSQPAAVTLSAAIDAALGSTQGDILYRGASSWQVLAPGTSGFVLATQGASANPQWASVSGSSGCTIVGGAQFQILVNNGSSGCSSDANASVNAGALSLGASGTPGSIIIGNATSGTITLQPATGALGTPTLSLPAVTGTLATTANINTALPLATASQVYIGTGAAGVAAAASTVPVAAIPLFTSGAAGGVNASGGGTTNFLRADNSWAAPIASVSITAANSNIVATPSPITGTGTIGLAATLTGETLSAGTLSGTTNLPNGGTIDSGGSITVGTTNSMNAQSFGFTSNTACSSGLIVKQSSPINVIAACNTFNLTNGLIGKTRTIASGSSDTISYGATTNDLTVFWKSASGAAKTQNIPGCTSTVNGLTYFIKDEQGDANTNNITITPASGTIEGASTSVINTARGHVHIQCDGSATNWNII